MEKKKTGNHHSENRDPEKKQPATNRDNSVVNKPEDIIVNTDRNEHYQAGGTGNITGTTSISQARNAGISNNPGRKEDIEDEDLSNGRGQFDAENPDDGSDDFLRGSGRKNDDSVKALKDNKLYPDFDRNSEV